MSFQYELEELSALLETAKKLYAPLVPTKKQANPDMYRRTNGRCPWRTQFQKDDNHPSGGKCVRVGPTRVSVEKWARNSQILKARNRR